MKKLILVFSILFCSLQVAHALTDYPEDNMNKAVGSYWALEDIGTLNNLKKSACNTGIHALTAGWSLTKIPFISIKHFVLQFVDLFCYSKDILKHSGLAGFNLFRLGSDIIAVPFVNGYNYPKQTAIVITTLVAAGALYEGIILAQDFDPADWSWLLDILGQFTH